MSQLPYPPAHPSASPSGPPPAGGRRVWLLLAVVLLVVALAAATTVAVVQTSRLADQRAATAAMQRQAEGERDEVRRLTEELAQAQQAPQAGADATDPLEELLEDGGLEDMLGEGGLEDLLGEDGLGGLLGEGGLEDLLGSAADGPDVSACTADLTDLPDVAGTTLAEQIDQTAAVVQQLRGRTFPDPVEPAIMTGEEIRAFFAEEIVESYPAEVADAERRTFGLLEAVPDDIDLVQTQVDLLGDQVAGFYDDETRELVVRAEDPDAVLGATGLITLAHELEHALTDATVGLPDLEGFGTDDDGSQAALAVVEGSAVALMSRFQLTALDPLSLLGDLGSALDSQQGLDQVPPLLREALTFPYYDGPGYVCSLYADGGWDAVDAALQDPPATTHAILFPGTGVEEPVAVPRPAGPPGWDADDPRTFGAAQLSWLLASPDGDESRGAADPVAAVEPWRGGEVSLWTSGEDSAVALVLSGAGLCEPVTDWWRAAADGTDLPAQGDERLVRETTDGTVGVVSCAGEDVRVGIGPDVEVARQAVA